jgi:hypothetical protein
MHRELVVAEHLEAAPAQGVSFRWTGKREGHLERKGPLGLGDHFVGIDRYVSNGEPGRPSSSIRVRR